MYRASIFCGSKADWLKAGLAACSSVIARALCSWRQCRRQDQSTRTYAGPRPAPEQDIRAPLLNAGLTILLLFFALIPPPAHSAQATFSWDYDASGAAGFVLYCWPASGSALNRRVDVGNTTTGAVTGLIDGRTYLCAATAYDSTSAESPYSNVVSLSIPYPPPIISLTRNPASGTVPLTVAFAGTSASPMSLWAWDFGDGATSTARNPAHVYLEPGVYTVQLTATSPGGISTRTATVQIKVTLPPAPVAGFSMSKTSGTVPLGVAFLNSTTGTVTRWAWDFGDGTAGNLKHPTHIYNAAGDYTVSMTATGPGGASAKTARTRIEVTLPPPPIARFGMNKAGGTVPLSVAFINNTVGTVTTWVWDFGDGTSSTLRNPTHVYIQPGNFTVSMLAVGPGGSSTRTSAAPIKVTLPPAPVAAFGMTRTSGTVPLHVAFSNNTIGTVSTWVWNFGDGGTSNTKSPTHVYNTPGNYTISLTATGPGGTSTKTALTQIRATLPPAPVPGFTISRMTGMAPLSVAFTNTTTGTVSAWLWNFGDGSASGLKNPTHVYTTPGSYTVALTASGPGGTVAKAAANPIRARSLVAGYAFNEASGSTAVDASGNGHTGTIFQAIRTASGKHGRALTFDGVNDWVTVVDSHRLDLTTGLTLSAWVYPTALWGWRTVIIKQGPGHEIYTLYANSSSDRPQVGIKTSTGLIQAFGPAMLPLHTWTHLAGSYDGSTLRLYVNGDMVASTAASDPLQTSTNALRIGGNSIWTNEFFAGRIDEARIYNRALSAGEILDDMNSQTGAP